MNLRIFLPLLALGAMGFTSVACGDDDDDGGAPTNGAGGRGGGSAGRGATMGQGGSPGGAAGSASGAAGSAGSTSGSAGAAGAAGGVDEGAAVAVKPVIYQLVVRHFGNLSTGRVKDGAIADNGVGKFADVNDAALDSLKAMGVTHVWYTGVLRQATLTDYSAVDPRMAADDPDVVKGRAGSFYAVRDYFDVSPDYAADPAQRMAEFEAMVQRTHAKGLKVLIDLVPNHTARNYGGVVNPGADFGAGDDQTKFFSAQNDYYYLQQDLPLSLSRPAGWGPTGFTFDGLFAREDGTAGKEVKVTGNSDTGSTPSPSPGATDWYETVKLNYGRDFVTGATSFEPRPSTWGKIDQVLAHWQSKGVDGFRCDFAHWVPAEAWQYFIGEARKRKPDAYFVAEAYENLGGLLAAGFDAVYNDELYDALRNKYRGAPVGDVDGKLVKLTPQERPRYVQYLENHDECRLASAANCDGGGAFFGPNAIRQLGPLSYLASNGPVIVYNGQEVGEDGVGVEGFGGEDGRTSIFDYWNLPALQKWSNGHAYDGGQLSADQAALRGYYGSLLAFAQDPLVRAPGFRSLLAANAALDNIYPFARYEVAGGRLLVVVVNFKPFQAFNEVDVKLPADLLDRVGIAAGAPKSLKLVFDQNGPVASPAATAVTREQLVAPGIRAKLPDQAAFVYVIELTRPRARLAGRGRARLRPRRPRPRP